MSLVAHAERTGEPPAQVAEGIYRLELPIPYSAGTVNSYLIDDDPLTLVDVGPNTPGALEEIAAQLAAVGRRIDDVGLILLTHPHADHTGLIGPLSERTGAEVGALELMVPFVEDFWSLSERDEQFAADVMLRYGMPPELIGGIRQAMHAERRFASVARVSRPLTDGCEVRLAGRSLTVHFRPGHSPVDTFFHDTTHGTLITGDHLLHKISSSPAVWAPLEGPPDLAERPRPLVEYTRSLEWTREQRVRTTLPGHGEPIDDHRLMAERRLALQERRAEKLTELVADGPATAHDLAHRTWGRFAETYPFPSLCEVVTHMDLLVAAGTVREVEGAGGVVHFQCTTPI